MPLEPLSAEDALLMILDGMTPDELGRATGLPETSITRIFETLRRVEVAKAAPSKPVPESVFLLWELDEWLRRQGLQGASFGHHVNDSMGTGPRSTMLFSIPDLLRSEGCAHLRAELLHLQEAYGDRITIRRR